MSSTGTFPTGRLATAEAAEQLIAERTARVDSIVSAAFARHLGSFERGVAAMAVGGFGRRELFPHSDVDVLVLTRAGLGGNALREPLGPFLRELWDSGLRLSQSVHTVAECCEVNDQNVELSISLLDR